MVGKLSAATVYRSLNYKGESRTKKFVPIIISIFAVVIRIVFVINGITTLKNKDLYDSTVTATGVDVQEEWDNTGEDSNLVRTVYIDYEIDGVKYEHIESPEQNNNMKVGDTVDILYQSKDPSKISGQNITKNSVMFIIIGAIAALGGCFSTLISFLRRK